MMDCFSYGLGTLKYCVRIFTDVVLISYSSSFERRMGSLDAVLYGELIRDFTDMLWISKGYWEKK